MIVPELTNVAYATIATGADERASRAGYALLVATGSVRDRLDAIDGRIDGLLVGIATSETVRMGDLGGALPTVLVNRHELLGLPSVTVDDETGRAARATSVFEPTGCRVATYSSTTRKRSCR